MGPAGYQTRDMGDIGNMESADDLAISSKA
jgi:hypothetical protein